MESAAAGLVGVEDAVVWFFLLRVLLTSCDEVVATWRGLEIGKMGGVIYGRTSFFPLHARDNDWIL